MLTDAKLRALKSKGKPYRVSDERGLSIQVSAAGSKLWRFRYEIQGKESMLALGQYPEVTLAQAREARDAARKLLAQGTDPAANRRACRDASLDTFDGLASEWLARRSETLAETSIEQVAQRLRDHILPLLGHLAIRDVTAPKVLAVVQRSEKLGLGETTHRLVQIVGQIMRYAVATNRAEQDPTPNLRGALKPVPNHHRPAILDKKVLAGFWLAAKSYPASPLVRAALQLQVLLFVRPGELRQAEWAEINWLESTWEIPGAKMKMREPHIVPLAEQVVAVLKDVHALSGGGRYVLPSPRYLGKKEQRPLSDNAVLAALRSMGYARDVVTGHGFRATARTLLDEDLGFRPEIIEMQLAHAVRDPLGRAYNRTKFLSERRRMMQVWADWMDQLGSDSAANLLCNPTVDKCGGP
jgi:integrase